MRELFLKNRTLLQKAESSLTSIWSKEEALASKGILPATVMVELLWESQVSSSLWEGQSYVKVKRKFYLAKPELWARRFM